MNWWRRLLRRRSTRGYHVYVIRWADPVRLIIERDEGGGWNVVAVTGLRRRWPPSRRFVDYEVPAGVEPRYRAWQLDFDGEYGDARRRPVMVTVESSAA